MNLKHTSLPTTDDWQDSFQFFSRAHTSRLYKKKENRHYSASDSYDKQYKNKVHLQKEQWKELF